MKTWTELRDRKHLTAIAAAGIAAAVASQAPALADDALTRRVDAVVIGQQDTHQDLGSSLVTPPI